MKLGSLLKSRIFNPAITKEARGPLKIESGKNYSFERMEDDGNAKSSTGFAYCVLKQFGSFLWTEKCPEDELKLFFSKIINQDITYEKPPGFYTVSDLSG